QRRVDVLDPMGQYRAVGAAAGTAGRAGPGLALLRLKGVRRPEDEVLMWADRSQLVEIGAVAEEGQCRTVAAAQHERGELTGVKRLDVGDLRCCHDRIAGDAEV